MTDQAFFELSALTVRQELQSSNLASDTLVLPLKRQYFEDIAAGTKPEEYRLATPYWRKRLEGRTYKRIVFTLGYPRADDHTRRCERPWQGYVMRTITHPHFGSEPVEVFAIKAQVTDTAKWDAALQELADQAQAHGMGY